MLPASHFLPIQLTKAFLKLILNAGDSVCGSDSVDTIDRVERGLIYHVLFLRPQRSWTGARCDPSGPSRCGDFRCPKSKHQTHKGDFQKDRLWSTTQVQSVKTPSPQGPPVVLSLPGAPLPESGCLGLGPGSTSR